MTQVRTELTKFTPYKIYTITKISPWPDFFLLQLSRRTSYMTTPGIIQNQSTRPNTPVLLTCMIRVLQSLSHIQINNQTIYSPTKIQDPIALVGIVYHHLLLFHENYIFRINIYSSTYFHHRISNIVLPSISRLKTPGITKPRIDQENSIIEFFFNTKKF